MGGKGAAMRALQRLAGNQAVAQRFVAPVDGSAAAMEGQAAPVDVGETQTGETGPRQDELGRPLAAPPTSPLARAAAVQEAHQAAQRVAASAEPEFARSVDLRPAMAAPVQAPAAVLTDLPAAAPNVAPEAVSMDAQAAEQAATETQTDEAAAQLAEAAPAADAAAPAAELAAMDEVGEEAQAEAASAAEGADAAAEGGPGPANASAVVEQAMSSLATPAAQVASLVGQRVAFAPTPVERSRQPRLVFEAAQKRAASEALAAAFVARNAFHAQNLVTLGMTAPPRILAVAAAAKAEIDTAVAQNIAQAQAAIAAAREQASAEAAAATEAIGAQRDQAIELIFSASDTALAEVDTAYTDASALLDQGESDQVANIEQAYVAWDPSFRAVGDEVGDEGIATAETRAQAWLAQRNGESSVLDGPIHDNRLEARADAARSVAKEYKKGIKQEADKQADSVQQGKPAALDMVRNAAQEARDALDQHWDAMFDALTQSEDSAVTQIEDSAERLIGATQSGLETTLASLDGQAAAEVARLLAFGASQKVAIDDQAAQAITALVTGAGEAVDGFNQALHEFVATALATEAPDEVALTPVLGELQGQVDTLAMTLMQQLDAGITASEEGVRSGGLAAVDSTNAIGQSAVAQAQATASTYSDSAASMRAEAESGFSQLAEGHQTTVDTASTTAIDGFDTTGLALEDTFFQIGDRVTANFENSRSELKTGLQREGLKNLGGDITKYADEAAAAVQPRWKKVVKWVITIAVIIAAIAITIVTAGAGGVVGGILIGAAVGGLAGATIQVGHNLVDGKKWSDGVGKAFVVGAIGGAFGGIGGALAKGVTNVGLKVATEVGVDAIGGIVGNIAVGDPITLEGIVMGAAVGIGISGGLGIAGALKGKIKIKPQVEIKPPAVTPQVSAPRPAGVDVAPPAPKAAVPEAPAPKPAAPEAPAPAPKLTAPEAPAPKAGEAPAAAKPAEATVPSKPAAEMPSPKAPETAPPLKAPETAPPPKAPETPAPKPAAEAPAPKPAGPDVPPAPKRSAHPDAPEIEPGVVAKAKTASGHEIKVLKDGRVAICTTCDDLRHKYAADLDKNGDLKKQLDDIEAMADEVAKAKAVEKFDADMIKAKAQPEPTVPKAEPEAPKPEAEAPKPEAEAPKPEAEAPKPEPEAPKPEPEAPKPEAPKPETPSGPLTDVEWRKLIDNPPPGKTADDMRFARHQQNSKNPLPRDKWEQAKEQLDENRARGRADEDSTLDAAGVEKNNYATDNAGNPRDVVQYEVDGVTTRPDGITDTKVVDIKSIDEGTIFYTEQLRAQKKGAQSGAIGGKKRDLAVVLSNPEPAKVRPSDPLADNAAVLHRNPTTGQWSKWDKRLNRGAGGWREISESDAKKALGNE